LDILSGEFPLILDVRQIGSSPRVRRVWPEFVDREVLDL
jgi:hypothetical protein